jgi:hypothetical protein
VTKIDPEQLQPAPVQIVAWIEQGAHYLSLIVGLKQESDRIPRVQVTKSDGSCIETA